MNELEVIRYLIDGIVRTCDCEFDDSDFEALRWLYKQYEYTVAREEYNYDDEESDGALSPQ